MSEQPDNKGTSTNQGGDADQELLAIQAILTALGELQPDQRQRVIDYAFQRLGLKPASPPPGLPPMAPMSVPASPSSVVSATVSVRDIRTLKEQKKPRSANEMAALVAYYLAELAPEGSRKSEIGTDEITTYFKQAGFPLPAVVRNTLPNAKAAGYFDNTAYGAYRLNPVGHNLVAHSLPADGGDGAISSRSSRGARKGGKRAKSAKGR